MTAGLLVGVAAMGCVGVVFTAAGPGGPESAGGDARDGPDATGEKPSGLVRWVTTVDHKDIGLLYLAFGTLAGLWGGLDAMMMRAELWTPDPSVWGVETYNALFTTHGLMMLFFFAAPVFAGIANYVLPLLIGADDMAYPRINAIAFWLLPPALLLVRAGLITEVAGKTFLFTVGQLPLGGTPFAGVLDFVQKLLALEPPTTGWTLYAPLSIQQPNEQIDLLLLGLHLSGISTTMGAINFIATIFTERDESVSWATLDLFSWNMLTQSGLVLFAFPVLGSTLIMLLLDRNFGTTFFLTEGGGPILYQHLFWFFGHPEVYILALPAFGLVSLILPKFAGRRLFGYRFVVYSTLAIGVLSFGVWAHHMFATGIDPRIRMSFMVVSIAIAVPSAIKTFNWLTTMWNGSLRLRAPMVFCIAGIALFVVGGVTGVFLASVPYDIVVHGTYYVVAHFHFIIVGIIPFGMFAASYYWFPLITGRMYSRPLALVHAGLTTVGVSLTFLPLFVVGSEGLPRRSALYPERFLPLQQAATVGAVLLGFGVVVWLFNVLQSYRVGRPVEDGDPWNLGATGQYTREWTDLRERLDDGVERDDDTGEETDEGDVSPGASDAPDHEDRPSTPSVPTAVSERGALKLVGVVFLGIVALAGLGQVGLPLTRFDSTTETLIRTLNRQLLLVAVPLVVVVEALLLYIVWRFRTKATPIPTPENRNLEIAWTVATALVLLFVGVLSYQVLAHPDVASTPDTAGPAGDNVTEIEVVSHQWYYSAEYADANVSDERAAVIYVPTDRPVRFRVTTTDVIHSFYVPQLGVKQDAIPGQENLVRTTVTEPGNYTLYCGEYCGAGHARMKTTVRALPPEAYRERVERLRARAERNQSGLRLGG